MMIQYVEFLQFFWGDYLISQETLYIRQIKQLLYQVAPTTTKGSHTFWCNGLMKVRVQTNLSKIDLVGAFLALYQGSYWKIPTEHIQSGEIGLNNFVGTIHNGMPKLGEMRDFFFNIGIFQLGFIKFLIDNYLYNFPVLVNSWVKFQQKLKIL